MLMPRHPRINYTRFSYHNYDSLTAFSRSSTLLEQRNPIVDMICIRQARLWESNPHAGTHEEFWGNETGIGLGGGDFFHA